MLTDREWVGSRRITSIVQLVTVIGRKSTVAWCTQKWLHYFKWSGETKPPNLKICRARVDKEGLSRMPTAWRSAKKLVHIMKLSQELGENVTSSYHGSKISGSQQSFLRKTVTCIVERQRKSMGYRFVPECNHAPETHTCQFFRFFFFCYISRTGTVCWDPEMLLPWQRDVMTSPLYWQCFEDILSGGV